MPVNAIIKVYRGTAAALASENRVLYLAEPAIETDTNKLKFGDGVTAYNSLPYFGAAAWQPLDATLDALAAYNSNGLLTQTAANTFTARTLTGTADKITVTNGDGVSGNPAATIASTYAGQTSITTTGTLGTGETGAGFTVALGTSTITGELSLARGGTGASLADPNADRLLFWDDSASAMAWLTIGTGLSISGTTITATAGGGGGGDMLAANNLSDVASVPTAVVNLGLTIGTNTQAWSADLDALDALGSTGIAVRTASNTWAQRTLTGTAAEVTVANGDGVSGNPTASLPSALTFTGKTVTGGTFTGGAASALTGLGIRSTGAAFDLTIASAEVLTAGRTLSVILGDAARTLTFAGNATIIGTNSGDQDLSGYLLKSGGTMTGALLFTADNTLDVGASGATRPRTGYFGTSVVAPAFTGNLTGNVTGNVTGNTSGSSGSCTGNAATATALSTPRNINGVAFDGTANITISTTIADGDKGDITVSSSGATWTIDTATISLAKMANLAQDQFIGRVTGSTGVPETATITAAARTVLDDSTVGAMVDTLGGAASIGTGGLVRESGSITGNAATATALLNARTINGVSFDGSANITVTAAADTLSGATLAAGVTASSLTSVGTLATLTVTATITGGVSGNAGTATALQTARTINGVSFDGTANITVPATAMTVADTADTSCWVALFESATGDLAPKTDGGLTYNANTGMLTATGFTGPLTGNASTATTLATPRTINGTSFDGSANITVTAAAVTLTGATLASGVTASSLTSTGTLTGGTWNATVIGTAYGATGVDNSTGGTANTFWARPNGATGAATYRAIVGADIPTLNQNTTGSSASCTGNATTATALATPRNINGVAFDGTANITISTTIADGDKGDITVSSSGATWTIDTAVVALSKLANLAQDQFIGRVTASTGVPETATITAAARTVLDDTSVADMVNTLGGASSGGTGGLSRLISPAFTTPNIGTATGDILTMSAQGRVRAGTANLDTLSWQCYDVDGGFYQTMFFVRSGNVPYGDLHNNVTINGNYIYRQFGTKILTDDGGTGVDNSTGGTANTFWARPNGATGAATYRAILAADIPTLNQNTTGSSASCTGNAATATALATARNINGVSFNGTANITVPAAATTLTGDTLASGIAISSLSSVATITTGTWNATTIAVAYGGTGASSAPDARTNLGLAIGSDVQAYDTQLTSLATLSYSGNGGKFIRLNAGASDFEFATVTGGGDLLAANNLSDLVSASTARTNLGLAIGSNVQAYDATLAAWAGFNTNGILTQTAADTFTGRTITGTTDKISVTNGDGVGGNPTLTIASGYVGQASITTLGAIATGVWNGTDIAVPDGGTGVSSLTAYAPIFGGTSSTGAVQSGTVGSSGQVMTSNGPGALATFQTSPTITALLAALPGRSSGTLQGLLFKADNTLEWVAVDVC